MAKYGKVAHGDGYVLSLLVLARLCMVAFCDGKVWFGLVEFRLCYEMICSVESL